MYKWIFTFQFACLKWHLFGSFSREINDTSRMELVYEFEESDPRWPGLWCFGVGVGEKGRASSAIGSPAPRVHCIIIDRLTKLQSLDTVYERSCPVIDLLKNISSQVQHPTRWHVHSPRTEVQGTVRRLFSRLLARAWGGGGNFTGQAVTLVLCYHASTVNCFTHPSTLPMKKHTNHTQIREKHPYQGVHGYCT